MTSVVEDTFDLMDRVVLVTGAAGLIGSHFCEILAKAHARVVAVDIDQQKTDDVVQKIRSQNLCIESYQANITDPTSVQTMMQRSYHKFGALDVLVHCAALDPKFDREHEQNHTYTFEDFPLETWKTAIDVNLTGAFICTQAAAKLMVKQGHGNIILFSSIYGMVAPDQRVYKDGSFKPPYYSVSKAGILGLTRYTASYYAGKNIRVNALSPGGIYNNHEDAFVEAYSARSIIGRMAQVSELDGALLFLASNASSYMTGSNLVVDGGWTAW